MSEKEPGIEEEVMNTLMDTWKEYPDMRLIQLIVNVVAPIDPDYIFNIEDSKLIQLLNEFKIKIKGDGGI